MEINDVYFPQTEPEFRQIESSISSVIDLDSRFPEFPVRTAGFAAIIEWDCLVSSRFAGAMQALCGTYGDSFVEVWGRNVLAADFFPAYGYYPAFRLGLQSILSGYVEAMRSDRIPSEETFDAFADMVDWIAMTGSTQRWAVWVQRDWEIGLLVTPDEFGPWQDTDMPFFPRGVSIERLVAPPGHELRIPRREMARFKANLTRLGSGPDMKA